MICAKCGTENVEGAKFCNECAAPLVLPAPAREQRKVVSVLFCDVTGSTELGERLDPEAVRTLLARYFARMKAIVESHGGTVEKFIGDAVMAVFGVPVVHEDDALRACRAAVEMRDALPAFGIAGRIGVMTGEVVTGTEERLATGDAVNVAARLEQAAEPGEVLIAEETLRLVQDAVEVESLEPLQLKGKAEAVRAFRLLAVPGGLMRRHEATMVGRETELRRLHDAFAQAVHNRSCQLFTLLGSAGVGKSRLAAEFLRGVDATTASGRCLSYGEGITYWPVVEIIKQIDALPKDVAAAEALRSLLGETEGGTSAEEIAWAFRKLLEERAAEHPLICVFDDLQWAEETLIDLVEHVADLSRDAPILLLCMARPDFLETRPAWGGGKWNATAVLLEPLDATETDRLLDELGGVDDALRERIVAVAEGNPLFLEEMVVLLRESGDETVAVPPTIQALLAARLDQLEPGERSVLECGSVEGRVFHQGSVAALSSGDALVPARLLALVRKELVRPDPPQFGEGEAFRFRHLLIRDAAYNGLPKSARAELHERFADWLEQHGESLVELEEILGYHLERACRYRVELGEDAESLHAISTRAAELLVAAGRRSGSRGDIRGSINFLTRARGLLARGRVRSELEVHLAYELLETGDFDSARDLALGLIEGATDDTSVLNAKLLLQLVRMQIDPSTTTDAILSVVEEAIAYFDDDANLARAWRALAHVRLTSLQMEQMDDALQHAADHARLAGDRRGEVDALKWLARVAWIGPMPVSDGRRRCEEILAAAGTDRGLESVARQVLGALSAMGGDFVQARILLDEAQATQIELGMVIAAAAGTSMMRGSLELLADDPQAAEASLRWGHAILTELGETSFLSTVSSILAEALFRQGRYDEAEAETRASETMSSPDDVYSHAAWRGVRAKVMAERGEYAAAEALAREAISLADATDSLEIRAASRRDLAHVLTLGVRLEEARTLLLDALAFAEQKEDRAFSAQIQKLLAEL